MQQKTATGHKSQDCSKTTLNVYFKRLLITSKKMLISENFRVVRNLGIDTLCLICISLIHVYYMSKHKQSYFRHLCNSRNSYFFKYHINIHNRNFILGFIRKIKDPSLIKTCLSFVTGIVFFKTCIYIIMSNAVFTY